jgi:hypothetical protein
MAKYRNTGAPWTREDGTVIWIDAVFEPTEQELAMFSYKLKSEPAEEVAEESESSTEETAQTWPMVMRPDLYLKLHPTGPHAELARRLVKEGETSGEQD